MTRHTRFTTILLLAAMPLAVMAAEPRAGAPGGPAGATQAEAPPLFKELDKNRDGYIDQSEARKSADLQARFATLDMDKDKRISVTEWQAGEQPRPAGSAGVSGESREPVPAPAGKSGAGMTKPLPDKY